MKKNCFSVKLEIIGINPFVFVSEEILNRIFRDAGKNKSPIPVKGVVNGKTYRQNLVKYQGEWRLYINTTMLTDSPKRIGEIIEVSISYDTGDRTISPHPDFVTALQKNSNAKKVFDSLPPSRKKEIIRYISSLKTEESRQKNIQKAVGFLTGKNRFIGRDKPV